MKYQVQGQTNYYQYIATIFNHLWIKKLVDRYTSNLTKIFVENELTIVINRTPVTYSIKYINNQDRSLSVNGLCNAVQVLY